MTFNVRGSKGFHKMQRYSMRRFETPGFNVIVDGIDIKDVFRLDMRRRRICRYRRDGEGNFMLNSTHTDILWEEIRLKPSSRIELRAA